MSCLDEQQGVPTDRAVNNDPSFRWAWNTPIVFSTVTNGVVYAGANVLFKSADRGGSWTRISPDLTSRIDRDTVRIMGKPVGRVNYSPGGGPAANPLLSPLFGAITWIGESPMDGRLLYTGTDDGRVHVTRDGGAHWNDVTPNIPGLPPHTYVTTVQPSGFVPGRVYATFDGHFNGDENAYVYSSEDFGQHWRAITTGLPTASIARIAEHPRTPNLLVVGHSRGVHFSNDAGASWHSLNTNMPTVPVRSVVFQARDNALVVGTYARGIWILDDAGPLERLTADAVKSEALIASVTRGREWNRFSLGPTYGASEFRAPNPEFDATVAYYVRDGANAATLTHFRLERPRRKDAHGARRPRTQSRPMGHALRSGRGSGRRQMGGVVPGAEEAVVRPRMDRSYFRARIGSPWQSPELRRVSTVQSPSKPTRWTEPFRGTTSRASGRTHASLCAREEPLVRTRSTFRTPAAMRRGPHRYDARRRGARRLIGSLAR